MPPDRRESARNTTFSDHNQVEHLLFVLVTLRAREEFFKLLLLLFNKKKGGQTLCRAAECESAVEDVVTGSELVETHVDVPGLMVILLKNYVRWYHLPKNKKRWGEEKYETGVHKVASYSDLKSRNKNLNLYQNI